MSNKVNACVYLDSGILEKAKEVGLNVSKVSENALVNAIGRLTGAVTGKGLASGPPRSFEGRGRDSNPGARLHRPIGY